MKQVILQKGKDKAVRHQHPWIFSGAIKTKIGAIENGDLVEVLSSDGNTVAYGVFNNRSRVSVRLSDATKT